MTLEVLHASSAMIDPLTFFAGGVSEGQVGLLIFHNSLVKTPAGPTRSYAHLSLSHTRKPKCMQTELVFNSTCLFLSYEAL